LKNIIFYLYNLPISVLIPDDSAPAGVFFPIVSHTEEQGEGLWFRSFSGLPTTVDKLDVDNFVYTTSCGEWNG
jgi:hypothetical protein